MKIVRKYSIPRTYLRSCRMSFALNIVIKLLGLAGMMMIGVLDSIMKSKRL